MKYIFFNFLFFSIIFANETEQTNPKIPLAVTSDLKDVIVIDPNQRAQDFVQAYEIIKKGKSPQSIFFHTVDGKTITNVVEMTPMNNGTLILFKITTNMGTKFELVPIENLISISQL